MPGWLIPIAWNLPDIRFANTFRGMGPSTTIIPLLSFRSGPEPDPIGLPSEDTEYSV